MQGTNNRKQLATDEFIVSAYPWVTSSTASGIVSHTFTDSRISGDTGWVTSFITIKNAGTTGSISYAFTQLGFSSNNYFPLSAGETISLPFSIKAIWISGSGQAYSIQAGITEIKASLFPTLSSSNAFPGVG